jgi:cyclic lactone autoinducer peptide
MFKKLNTFLLGSLASFIAVVAALAVSPACASTIYEPPIPKELQK